MINRKIFFDGVRNAPFDGSLTVGQVEGMNAILDEWERRKLSDLRHLAYMLATPFHETGGTMQPVIETRQPSEQVNPSVETAIGRLERAWSAGKMPWVKRAYWRKDDDGLSWLGRGLPQVTHRANYEWAEAETGIPFTKDPQLMLVMKNAVPVMFIGMLKGKFTGKRLSDYFDADTDNAFEARRIINATESAAKVAAYHASFLRAVKAAWRPGDAPASRAEPPKPPEKPRIDVPKPSEYGAQGAELAPTFWGRVADLFKPKG